MRFIQKGVRRAIASPSELMNIVRATEWKKKTSSFVYFHVYVENISSCIVQMYVHVRTSNNTNTVIRFRF